MRDIGPPIKMIVDWGQVDSGLNAIKGAVEGLAGKRTLAELGPKLRAKALQDFGRRADVLSLEDNSGIAHVYEWGMAGTPAGRLWYALPSTVGQHGRINFAFRDSNRPVPIGGTDASDRAARAEAAEAGATRAIHVWKRKAEFLEYNTTWMVEAGNPNPETLDREGSSSPTKYLLIQQPNGEILWRKRWRNYSEYTGNFTAFFEGFWSQSAPRLIEQDLNEGFERKIRPYIQAAINESVRGKGMIRPGTVAAAPGVVNMYVNGKPFTGKFGNKANKTIERRVRKSMKENWR